MGDAGCFFSWSGGFVRDCLSVKVFRLFAVLYCPVYHLCSRRGEVDGMDDNRCRPHTQQGSLACAKAAPFQQPSELPSISYLHPVGTTIHLTIYMFNLTLFQVRDLNTAVYQSGKTFPQHLLRAFRDSGIATRSFDLLSSCIRASGEGFDRLCSIIIDAIAGS